MVLALLFIQAVLGQVSYRLSVYPPLENMALLATYAVVAAIFLRRSMRLVQAVWAEALAVRPGEAKKLRCVLERCWVTEGLWTVIRASCSAYPC